MLAGRPDSRVFISYSRRDYYFAESLTFQLHRAGVRAWMDVLELVPGSDWERALFESIDACAAFVLVTSPAALESPHVRSEWRRALERGKRIVLLGWHRRVRLPAELQDCEWLDFRGRFGTALSRLVDALGRPAGRLSPAGARPGRGPWLPPGVQAVMLPLILPIAGYALVIAADVANYRFGDLGLGLGPTGDAVLAALFASAIVWVLSLSLLQRRMGMTRLMLMLAFVSTPFVLAVGSLEWRGEAGLGYMPPLVAAAVLEHLTLVRVMAGLPIITMVVLWWTRPGDLLRWMPTGKGWSRFRRSAAGTGHLSVASTEQALGAIRRFELLHDPSDQPMAERLRRELESRGAVHVADHEEGATTVLLLTARCTTAWLDRDVRPRGASEFVTVVGSAIDVASGLEWLWKRQWIDLRRWSAKPAEGESGLPGLPEAVTRVRLPPVVARLHLLLGAFAALVATVAVVLSSDSGDEISVPQAMALALFLASAWLAHRVARREMSYDRLRRYLPACLVSAVLGIAILGLFEGRPDGSSTLARLWAAAGTVIAAWAYRTLPQVRFWLPAITDSQAKVLRLKPPANWRTFGTVLAFMFLWVMSVQIFAPKLM
jgi:hypothetical protein